MAKTSALSSGGEAIHTRTDAAGTAESQVAVLGIDGSDSVISADTSNGLDVDVTRLPALVASSANIGDVDVLTVPAPLSTTGAGSEATALRVTVANNSSGVLHVDDNGGALSVDDNGGSLTVDGPVTDTQLRATPVPISGTVSTSPTGEYPNNTSAAAPNGNGVSIWDGTKMNTARSAFGAEGATSSQGKGILGVAPIIYDAVGAYHELNAPTADASAGNRVLPSGLMGYNGATFDRLRSDTTNGLDVDVTRLPSLVAGTANIGDVDVLTLPGSLTGKAEDTGSTTGDVGIPILGVRNDTPTALTDTDADYTMMATDKYGRVQIAPVRSLPKTVAVSGSLGITTAATWDERAVWAVPASTLFAPKMARAAVTTASTRTLILAGKQLGTFNPGTNTYTATASVSGNDFYDRMMYRIAVTHSATATTVTATYTDQGSNAGNATGGLVIPSAAVAGDWYEFILSANDFGVQSVSAVSDTANPTSVVDEIWGFRTLLEDLGTAITPHIAYLGEGLQVPNGESIVILFNAAATTAQQRFASVLGDLVAA